MAAGPDGAVGRGGDRAGRTAILIAGPTASGKSAFALALAGATGGLVVNADAMQVYRELRILTARPSGADEAAAPHRLYGHVGAAEPYSAARWVEDCLAVIDEAAAAGVPAIVVGGTGLYFEALTRGLSPVPAIPEDVREHWRRQSAVLDAAALHGELARRDPAMAGRLPPSDTQRLVRALEVIEGTGRSLADWQAIAPVAPLESGATRRIVIAPERAWLHRRIAARFAAMVDAGAVAEAAAFDALALDPAMPATRAIGVAPLVAHIRGDLSLEEAESRSVIDSRRYAKRQETWFRNRMTDWERVDPRNISEAAEQIAKECHRRP